MYTFFKKKSKFLLEMRFSQKILVAGLAGRFGWPAWLAGLAGRLGWPAWLAGGSIIGSPLL